MMGFPYSFLLFLLSIELVLAAPPAAEFVKRDQVGICKDLLIVLKASSFCSSVLGLHDATSTVISTGSTQHITTTLSAAPCTNTVAAHTDTLVSVVTLKASTITYTTTIPASTATTVSTAPAPIDDVTKTLPAVTDSLSFTANTPVITDIVTTNLPESIITSVTTSTDVIATTTITTYTLANNPSKRKQREVVPRACNIPKLPPGIEIFACDVISAACSEFVHPQTITTHVTVPGSIYTSTTTSSALCATFTPAESFKTTYSTVTPPASTFRVKSIPPPSKVIITTTLPTVTEFFTTQLPDSTVDITVTPPAYTLTSFLTEPALTTTSKTTAAVTATSTIVVQGSTTFTNNCNPATQEGEINLGGGLTGHYDVRCNMAISGAFFVQSTTTQSFSDCLNYCNNNACDSIQWNIKTGLCSTYDGAPGVFVTDFGFDSALLDIDGF